MPSASLSIGEVARRAGLNASAIRFYERAGLLPKPIRIGGRRRYTDAIADRLALLEYAKYCGFKLEEIRYLFHGFRDGVPMSARWQQLARKKVSELDKQMEQIELMKNLLERALKCRCVDLEECGRRVRERNASR
ncbi:MAG: MerR family transcriptional regulator [Acidobacteria bacterium]|jgi:MerR family redox-sensitive transcriptional activator SoxR|nr:MAG: MerR family transcriptional regulator [Acidobacteriota bacterium]